MLLEGLRHSAVPERAILTHSDEEEARHEEKAQVVHERMQTYNRRVH